MFKLAITALVASVSANAAADKKAMDKDASNAESAASKYKVTPSAKIWTENKSKKENFMADTAKAGNLATSPITTGKKTIDDFSGTKDAVHGDCQSCVLSGNTYTAYKKAVAADKTAKPPVKAADAVNAVCASPVKGTKGTTVATVGVDLTYGEFMDGMAECSTDYTATSVCMEEPFVLADFNKGASTGKKGDKPYHWAYTWQEKASAWDSCFYTATMPKSFKGGLLLTHALTDDTQAVVRIVNSKNGGGYLYNSFTLDKLSVGKTSNVIVPFADSIDISFTAMSDQKAASAFSISFKRQTNEQIAAFTLEHGGVIVWVIIGIVVFCLLCVGVIVWKKCFHKTDDFYVEDCYARV